MKYILTLCLYQLVVYANGQLLYSKKEAIPSQTAKGESFTANTFENSLILDIGYYYYQARTESNIDNTVKEQLRKQLKDIEDGLSYYYLISGKLPVDRLKKDFLNTNNKSMLPDTMLPLVPATMGGSSLQSKLMLSNAYSIKDRPVVVATPNSLTVLREGSLPFTKSLAVTNPVYGFSKENALYVVDQLNPSQLIRIDSEGKESTISLPDSLARLGYRIDQILPDRKLVVARRVKKGPTVVSVWNFDQKRREAVASFDSQISNGRIDLISKNDWLLAAYQADKQAYTLFLNRGGSLTRLPTGLVTEYTISPKDSLLVAALQTDSSLVSVGLESVPQSHTISPKARYFNWQGDRLVYWQKRDAKNPYLWDLFVHNFSEPSSPAKSLNFSYTTDLRRDVPRITLQKDAVYFEDRSNNTGNFVRFDRPDLSSAKP